MRLGPKLLAIFRSIGKKVHPTGNVIQVGLIISQSHCRQTVTSGRHVAELLAQMHSTGTSRPCPFLTELVHFYGLVLRILIFVILLMTGSTANTILCPTAITGIERRIGQQIRKLGILFGSPGPQPVGHGLLQFIRRTFQLFSRGICLFVKRHISCHIRITVLTGKLQLGLQSLFSLINKISFGRNKRPIGLYLIKTALFLIGKRIHHRAAGIHAPHTVHRHRIAGNRPEIGILVHNLYRIITIFLLLDLPQSMAVRPAIHVCTCSTGHINLMKTVAVGRPVQHVKNPTFARHLRFLYQ